jgi:S1-C subfamily serine protease
LLTPQLTEAQVIPTGQCAVIVASRVNMAEVQSFMSANSHLSYDAVYAAENGWLAISIGLLPEGSSTAAIAGMKQRGVIPQDALCSQGRTYLSRVWSPQSGPNASPETPSVAILSPFDARPLSNAEKKLLQAGLVFEGYYSGMIDGAWGSGTQGAFESFALNDLNLADVNVAAAILTVETLDRLSREGWQYSWIDNYRASLYLPSAITQSEWTSEGYLSFRIPPSAVSGVLSFSDTEVTYTLHEMAAQGNTFGREPYFLRRDDLLVTSVTTVSGQSYVRSDWIPDWQIWVHLFLSYPSAITSDGAAELIAAAYSLEPQDSFWVSQGSHLDRVVNQALTDLDTPEATETLPEPPPLPPSEEVAEASGEVPDPVTGGSGTGFFVNADGQIMTNNHVIAGCETLLVDGQRAKVISQSETFDLAILQIDEMKADDAFLSFSDSPARLNSDITVAGYPLISILGGLNVTRGSISAMEGFQGDSASMQISAPVQPGNSGGPIVDQSGRIVGIVVSKLDAGLVQEMMGDIPQNVNFGIRGQIGQMFAEMNGVTVVEQFESEILAPEELAEKLAAATVLIQCN